MYKKFKMDYKYYLVSLVLLLNSLPSNVYCKYGKHRQQHESSSSIGDSFPYSNHNEIYEDQIATETNLWRPITTKTVASSENEANIQVQQQKYAIRHGDSSNKGTRQFLEFSDLDPLSSSGSAQDYVKKALEMRLKHLNEETDGNSYTDQDSAHSFSHYTTHTRHETPDEKNLKKMNDIEKQKEKIVRVIRPDKPPQIKVMLENSHQNVQNYGEESQYSTLPTPESSTASLNPSHPRPRKRLRIKRPYNTSDASQPSDSMIQYSYMTPKDAADQIKRPYVSKSPTYRHSDYSTSTNYYYEPTITDTGEDRVKPLSGIEKVKGHSVQTGHKSWKQQPVLFNQTNFEEKFGYGMKMGTRPQNDYDAYFYTHPTPNPVTSTTPSTTSSTRRPYRTKSDQKLRSNNRPAVQTAAHSTYRPHVTPYEKKYRTTIAPQTNIKANVITNSDNGQSKEEIDTTTPLQMNKKQKVLTIRTKPHHKMRIIIKTTPRPLMQQIQDMEEIAHAAESQIVTSVKLPPNTKVSTGDGKVKHHTPNFEFNEYEKTRVPVYYNVNLDDINGTISPPFNNGKDIIDATLSPVSFDVISPRPNIDNQFQNAMNEPDRRSMMTYAPDEEGDTTPKSLPRKALNVSNPDGDLDAEASGKNQYVILYDVEDKPKYRPRPRPKTTPKPTHVTQQIHYHHHGGNTQEKTYNTGGEYSSNSGYKSSYVGNKGNSYVEEEEDDDGPDVTHTHHEYVHFDNEPAITHHYQNGPMTDHYDISRPASNAIYDMKTAKDYDFRHSASHDLDTRHVPVGDYETIRSSHMYNSGKVDDTFTRNTYGERPFYYYQSERQIDQYDNQAFGSSPQKTIARPNDSMRKHTLKVVDPNNPKQTVEITKDDYVRHVKLAVEKYLKSTDAPSNFQHSKDNPYFKPSKPFNFDDHYDAEDDEATNVYPKKRLPPTRDMNPPKGFMKPIERPPDFSEGYPLTMESFNSLKDNLEAAYGGPPIKPVTLPPRKPMQQFKRIVPSTPNPFMARPNSGNPLPPFGAGKYPPNFKIMHHMKMPKNTFGAGRPLQDHIYNLQENLAHDVDLTVKNLKSTARPLDMSTIEVGQLYHHGNPFDPTKHGGNPPNFDSKPRLQFNNQVYHDINSLMNKNIKQFQDSETAQTHGFVHTDSGKRNPAAPNRSRRPQKHVNDATGVAQGVQSITHNTAAFNNELENSPIHIINGIPVANPYNIDMDTLKYMLGGMQQELGPSTVKDPADPFNMKTLKSIPNVATVPTIASSFSSQNLAFQHPPKFSSNFDSSNIIKNGQNGRNKPKGFTPSPMNPNSNFGNSNSLANNPFQASQQWESNFNQPFSIENMGGNAYTFTTPEPQLYLKAFRRVPNKNISSKTGKELTMGLKPPPEVMSNLVAVKKKKRLHG